PADRSAHVRAFVDAAPDLRAAGYVDTESSRVVFANSAGHRAASGATRATVDGIHQTASSAGSAHQTSARFAELDGGAAGALAGDLARRGEDPIDVDPGRYEVVLSPECVATILIFLSFYGFNAKQHLEGQSFVRLGEAQFDPTVSVWDDATDPRAIALPFDAEGTPKQRLDLVTNGTSTALAHDRRTAARSDTASTGHALHGGESMGPVPLNLFLGRGDASGDELIAEVERGILVTTFNYCRALDPKTQVVTGLTRNGTFLVEGGEIGKPLTNLRFTQSFVEALSGGRVLGLGSDARFADSELGPGMVHTPSIRLAEWNFTGGAQG
ncbi:MAG: metallopeptidase TldD-related protein, partial [Nitriliruptorales bacterium]